MGVLRTGFMKKLAHDSKLDAILSILPEIEGEDCIKDLVRFCLDCN